MEGEQGQEAGASEEAAPPPVTDAPHLNDALQALHAQQSEILREVRGSDGAEEGESDGELAEGGEEPGGEFQPNWDELPDELSPEDWRSMAREEAANLIRPYATVVERREMQREVQRREQEIRGLAEEFPRLKEPEVVGAVAETLERLAEMTGDRTVRTNPEVVRLAYEAFEARSRAASETPVGAGGRGATLETGAGPGPAPSDVDPVEQQYTDAIVGRVGKDPLTS